MWEGLESILRGACHKRKGPFFLGGELTQLGTMALSFLFIRITMTPEESSILIKVYFVNKKILVLSRKMATGSYINAM